MNKQRGFQALGLAFLVVVGVGYGSWLINAVKLASCDFRPDYRCEALHGAGLVIPPLSIVTVWFGDDGA